MILDTAHKFRLADDASVLPSVPGNLDDSDALLYLRDFRPLWPMASSVNKEPASEVGLPTPILDVFGPALATDDQPHPRLANTQRLHG